MSGCHTQETRPAEVADRCGVAIGAPVPNSLLSEDAAQRIARIRAVQVESRVSNVHVMHAAIARSASDAADPESIQQEACRRVLEVARSELIMHAHELPPCGTMTATEWVRAADDTTQARLLVHMINRHAAEEEVMRVMAIHGNHLGQPTAEMAPEVQVAMATANDWYDRSMRYAEQASAAMIASMLAHLDEVGPVSVDQGDSISQ